MSFFLHLSNWDETQQQCTNAALDKAIPGRTDKRATPGALSTCRASWKELCKLFRANSLLVSVEGGVCEAFAVVLPEELAVAHSDVVDLVAGATPVHPLPLLRRLLSFSAFSEGGKQTKSDIRQKAWYLFFLLLLLFFTWQSGHNPIQRHPVVHEHHLLNSPSPSCPAGSCWVSWVLRRQLDPSVSQSALVQYALCNDFW